MSRSRSQRLRLRRGGIRRFTAAALCALTCLGDLPPLLQSLLAQEPVAASPAIPEKKEPEQATAPANPVKKKQDLDSLLAKKGTLILREGSLADWMLAIQKTWGIDIVYDDEALRQEQFTGSLTDKSLKEILDTILPPKNYGYRRTNDILLILPQDQIGEGNRPDQKLELIEMEFVQPAEIDATLKLLLSPQGKTQPIPSSKTIMVIDYADNIAAIKDYIKKLDSRAGEVIRKTLPAHSSDAGPNTALDSSDPGLVQPVEQTVTTVIWLKYVVADNVLEAVQSQIGEGTVSAVPDMNALVVSGSQSAVTAATQMIKQLDVVRQQVRISVLMYDIRIDALEQLGINWRNAGKGRISANGVPSTLFDLNSSPMALGAVSSSGSTGTGTTGTTGTTTTAPPSSFVTSAAPNLVGSALTLTHLSRHFDLSAVIIALDQTDGARLLARPSIRCYDQTEAEIKIISEIPVQQLTQTEGGGTIGTTTFREAGVSLKVTPFVGDDQHIKLNLVPEFSVLTGFQNGQPIIDRRVQTATVAVTSGDTLVLGGLRRRNELETVGGIPGLMNLKYFGNLFRAHRTTVEESELITFIHTEIIPIDDQGSLREQIAEKVVNETLDRIPVAGHSPYLPSCNDPYCPIHNPRPKYWPGSMLAPDSEVCESMAPNGNSSPDGYETLPPAQGQPITPDPAPVLPPAPETDESDEETLPPAPVVIDETARRARDGRTAMRRLPAVYTQPAPQRLPAVSGGSSTRFANRSLLVPPPAPVTPAPEQPRQTTGWKGFFR